MPDSRAYVVPAEISAVATQRRRPTKAGIETRSRIITSAIAVFGRKGYHRATLREIAQDTGVTAASIIQLFGSKKELLLTIFKHWEERYDGFPREAEEEEHPMMFFAKVLQENQTIPGLFDLHITLCAEALDSDSVARPYLMARYERIIANTAAIFLERSALGRLRPMTRKEATAEASKLFAIMDGIQIQAKLLPGYSPVPAFTSYLEDLERRLRREDAASA